MSFWLGKRCPWCHKDTVNTTDSRIALTTGWRRRRKTCRNCGKKGTTLEIPVEPGMKPMIAMTRARGGAQTHLFDELPLKRRA